VSKEQREIIISSPSKIMLAGEYSVLNGYRSLSLATCDRLTVHLKEQINGPIQVSSDLWEKPYFCDFKIYKNEFAHDCLLDTIYHLINSNISKKNNFHIHISSKIDVAAGFGSSSALRLAVVASFYLWNYKKKCLTIEDVNKITYHAFKLQKNYQKHASGYDVLNQSLGGAIVSSPLKNKQWPGNWKAISLKNNFLNYLHVCVGKKGSATRKTIKQSINIYKKLINFCTVSEILIDDFVSFLKEPESKNILLKLFSSMRNHRELIKQLPSYPKEILAELEYLPGLDSKWSFKPTGAGGLDAILLIGSKDNISAPLKLLEQKRWQLYPIQIDNTGIKIHSS
jgi:mevalonate kinase